ncbi:unnamed protein product [Clonostachys chloroleuca]|uniref:Uncharacterized protein n=1 Tax=Clonostachys chloroleuca TaxID=1926264 RepID=A0AA35M5X8_9HYPO|nr:unnamed protein product [Clonostachys chloroleuca]
MMTVGVGLIMLVPLLCSERVVLFPRNGHAGKQHRPFLYGTELMEITAEEYDRDASEVLRRASKPAKLLVYHVQGSRPEHAYLVDDQQMLFLPICTGGTVHVSAGRGV